MTENTRVVRHRAGAGRESALSSWDVAERAVVFVVAALALMGLAGLVLALLGAYSTWLAALIALPPVAVAALALGRLPASGLQFSWQPLVVALALTVALTAFWGMRPSQHVLTNRDPGAYATTAVLIAETGSLRVDQSDTPFRDLPEFPQDSSYSVAPGEIEFQFNHLLQATMAPVWDLFGPTGLFRFPALVMGLGMAALYFFAARATRRPWLALAVPAVLGVSLPMLYVGRDTFSESITLALLWAGLLAAIMALRAQRALLAVVSGFLIGATTAARIDSLTYVIAVAPLLVFWVGTARGAEFRSRARIAGAAVLGAALPMVIGWIDLQWFSGNYAADLGSEVAQLRIALVGIVLAAIVATLVAPPLLSRIGQRRSSLAFAAGVGVVVVLCSLWFVRPLIPATGAESPALTGYQVAEGIEVDPSRTHYESAFEWMEWYYGPVVVGLVVAGFGLTTNRVLMGRARDGEVVALAIGGAVGLLYWLRPSIFADQPWASRRFAPGVYPAAVLMAAFAVSWLSAALRSASQLSRRAIVGAVVVVMVLGPLQVMWPLRWGRSQAGYEVALDSLCENIGPDAAVVTIRPQGPRVLPGAVRAFCEVPSVAQQSLTPEQAGELANAWSDQGRSLWVVSLDRTLVEPFAPDGSSPVESLPGVGDKAIERTLTRAPEQYRPDETMSIWAVEVDPAAGSG